MQTSIRAYFSILLFLLVSQPLFAKNTQLKFLIKHNNKPLSYANVCWQVLHQSKMRGHSVSDENGFVAIPVEPGSKVIIAASCVGFKTLKDTIQLGTNHSIYVEEDVLNLDQVTITGTRSQHTLKNAPVLTQMISEKEIEAVDSETLTDILEVEMPGMEMASHGGTPVMNMMGLESQYSLVMIDGARLSKGLHKSIDYSRINTANIERIEIVRGASSALYGSNAMGGVINVITKTPPNKV